MPKYVVESARQQGAPPPDWTQPGAEPSVAVSLSIVVVFLVIAGAADARRRLRSGWQRRVAYCILDARNLARVGLR